VDQTRVTQPSCGNTHPYGGQQKPVSLASPPPLVSSVAVSLPVPVSPPLAVSLDAVSVDDESPPPDPLSVDCPSPLCAVSEPPSLDDDVPLSLLLHPPASAAVVTPVASATACNA
jgi:hypothetical protein